MRICTLKTGLFFGTDTGNTEDIADKICDQLANYGCVVDMHDVSNAQVTDMENYELLILGIPTWNYGGIQGEWEDVEENITSLNLSGKIVALYGLGDQFGYAEFFLDAMGWLNEHVLQAGATVIGHWPTEGYDFEESRAANADKSMFCGLAIDEDQQFELTDGRIQQWVEQLAQELEQAAVA